MPAAGIQRRSVGLTALAMLIFGFGNRIPGFVLSAMSAEFGVAMSTAALIQTSEAVGILLGCLLGGRLGDRQGRRTMLLGSLGLFGVATLLGAAVGNITLFATMRLVTGLAFGAAIPNAVALSSESASTRYQPIAVTLTMAGISLGSPLVRLAFSLDSFGWRGLFLASGMASVLTAAVLLAFLPESNRISDAPNVSHAVLFSRPRFVVNRWPSGAPPSSVCLPSQVRASSRDSRM